MFFYLFALVISIISPAFAEDKVLAIVIGPETYTENEHFNAAFKTLGDVNPAAKAKSVAEALKNRVDKVELLTSSTETTKSNIEARLNALPYEGHFDHVILFWFGWSYNGFTYQMGSTKVSSNDTFIPCSDLSLDVETVDLSPMKESSFSPEELSLLLLKIAPHRSVILDVNRTAWIYAAGDVMYRFKPGLTAPDWPKDDNAVIMSAPSSGNAASDLALYVTSVLAAHKEGLSYVDFLAALMRASMERGEIMTVPAVYGALTHDADAFLGPVRPELAPKNPYATPSLPPAPVTVSKTGNKKAAWWSALGVAGLCAVGGAAEVAHYEDIRDTVKNDPASYASYEDYLAAIKSANTSLGAAGVLGGCAVLGGSVGTLGLTLKW